MVAGLAGAFSLIGTLASVAGSFIQYSASQKAEKARKRQAELEAMRQRREQVRQAQVASAKATASAETQGALQSSALAGGIAQVQNQAARNINAITQDQQLGDKIFKANQQYAFGGLLGSLGGGISSLGGAFSQNAGTLTRLGYG